MSDYDIKQFIKTGSAKLGGSGGPGPSQMSLSEPVIKGNWLAYETTFKPESGTEQEAKFFISVAKPYLLIEISASSDVPNFILEKVESKEFDMSEYEGHEIQVKEIQHIGSFCEPSGVAGAVIKNIGRKPIYTSKIEVMQVKPSDASVSVTWDKQAIQPGENAVFRDQCEESDEWRCLYQITSPSGTVIHISMDCGELLK
ncbi:MAG: hypothetical protein U9Q92_07890, partial [archaeon]|nr:hypothetical protein [archaeon]